jgi:hypothetical protein
VGLGQDASNIKGVITKVYYAASDEKPPLAQLAAIHEGEQQGRISDL